MRTIAIFLILALTFSLQPVIAATAYLGNTTHISRAPAPIHASSRTIHVPGNFSTVQEAIDNATDGDIIVIDSGIYSEYVSIDGKSNIVIRGVELPIIRGGGSGTVFSVKNSANVTIEGIRVDNGYAGIYIYRSNNITIHGVQVRRITPYTESHAILVDHSSNINITSVFLDSFGTLTLTYSSNIHIYNAEVRYGSGGLYTFRSNNVYVNGIVVRDYIGGLIIDESTYIYIDNATVVPYRYVRPMHDGIRVFGGSSNIYIENAYIKGPRDHGIRIHESSSNILLRNITVASTGGDVAYVDSCGDVLLENIVFPGTVRYGARVFGSSNVTLRSMNLTGVDYGVYVQGSTDVAVESSVLIGSPGDSSTDRLGIYAVLATELSVADTEVSGFWNGIHLWRSIDTRISRVRIHGNAHHGIVVWLSSDTTIEDSMTYGNNVGVHIHGSDNTYVYSTTITGERYNGIIIEYTHNNTQIDGCVISGMRRAILVYNAGDIAVRDTRIMGTTNGVVMLRASSMFIVGNSFDGNTIPVVALLSDDIYVYINNFTNNRYLPVSLFATVTYHSPVRLYYYYNGTEYLSYMGNYWDTNTGNPDLDGDGICDTPYVFPRGIDEYPLAKGIEEYDVWGAPR